MISSKTQTTISKTFQARDQHIAFEHNYCTC